eukprot:m.263776 g.263776  ORF g.263776 m.263776 type:complete len:206 (+) comp54649_c0_seq24:522-1139(+)
MQVVRGYSRAEAMRLLVADRSGLVRLYVQHANQTVAPMEAPRVAASTPLPLPAEVEEPDRRPSDAAMFQPLLRTATFGAANPTNPTQPDPSLPLTPNTKTPPQPSTRRASAKSEERKKFKSLGVEAGKEVMVYIVKSARNAPLQARKQEFITLTTTAADIKQKYNAPNHALKFGSIFLADDKFILYDYQVPEQSVLTLVELESTT